MINLPGRAPGYKSDIVSLLPTGHKQYVYQCYCLAREAITQSNELLGFSKVLNWFFFPNLPQSLERTYILNDKNSSSILKSWDKDEKENRNSGVIQKHEKDLNLSSKQWSDYETRYKNSQSVVKNDNRSSKKCYTKLAGGRIIYSFGFAQQISYSNNPD